MSTIGSLFHNENICDIIPTPSKFVPPTPEYGHVKRYKLTQRPQVGLKGEPLGHKTFGYAHYYVPLPGEYLKKGEGVSAKVTANTYRCGCFEKLEHPPFKSKVPPVTFTCPKRNERDFVKENIEWADSLKTKDPVHKMVDDCKGHISELITQPEKETIGKLPKYMCKRKQLAMKRLAEEKELDEAIQEYKNRMGIGSRGMEENVYLIDTQARQKLLDDLKEHWSLLTRKIQILPVVCDTTGKIRNKLQLEREIKAVEKDIKMVEGNPYLYLERTDPRPLRDIVKDELKAKRQAERPKRKEEISKEETESAKLENEKEKIERKEVDFEEREDERKESEGTFGDSKNN